MRTVHRILAVFFVVFALYVGATGVFTQLVDFQALLRHAPATDPTMKAIRVGHDGPPNFQVIREPDYAAAPLPAAFDFDAALAAVARGEQAEIGAAPLSFLELRTVDGKPVGQVASRGLVYRLDGASGQALDAPVQATLAAMELPSLRNAAKSVHRMGWLGPWGYLVDVFVGLGLATMLVTGLILYLRLLSGRARTGRKGLFWLAGGWWRTLHRATAVAASAFLCVVALSGTFLAVNALGINISKAVHGGKRPGISADVSSPLTQAELPGMMHATLAAYRAAHPGASIIVLRLRYFAGMPQGVVIGGGKDVRQWVFNARTGRPVSQTEPGYPYTDMPFGWQAGQIAKQVHRGDIIGLSGRTMDVLAGLSLIYLSVSGAVMYFDLWSRRRKMGRSAVFWS